MTSINGLVAPGFERVRDAFADNFESHGDVGAAVAVCRQGAPVVSLWAGHANTESGEPWEEDTLVRIASSTKGVTAVCGNLLVQRGLLSLDAPVVGYWPEFAAEGKERITVRQLLSHQAGLAVVDHLFTAEDIFATAPIVEVLAAAKPFWEPGTAHGYHGQSFGYLVGELLRRVTGGQTVGQFLASEVVAPLELDLYLGAPTSVLPRIARVISPAYGGDRSQGPDPAQMPPEIAEQFALMMRAAMFTHLMPDYNAPEWLQVEMPSANAVTSARSLAKLYGSLVSEIDGVRLFSPETTQNARACQSEGVDKILGIHSRWGLGFSLAGADGAGMIGPGSFGHAGAGGSIGLADPESEIGFGYVMNFHKMGGDERAANLIAAVRESL